MCRMFAYAGTSREELIRLVEALAKSAQNDTMAPDENRRVHRDGWGFAIYSEMGLSFHKSAKPMFECDRTVPATGGHIYAIFHARQASEALMVGDAYSHPYTGETRESLLFFAHNGSVDKRRLRGLLRFRGVATDSELAMKNVLGKDLKQATAQLEGFTNPNSALNLVVLQVSKAGGADVYVKHFYNRDPSKQDRSKYYEIEYQRLREGRAAFSSTLNDYGFSGRPVEGSELTSVTAL